MLMRLRSLFRRGELALSPLDDKRLRELGVDPDSIRAGMTDRFPPLVMPRVKGE